MSALKGATSAYGSYSDAKAIKAQGAYESQQLEFNSRIAELQAKKTEADGKEQSTQYKTKIKQLIGKQRASMAAQGIEVGSGSALEVQLETKELGALDALTIRNNAFREAMGYRIQSIDYTKQAAITRASSQGKARNTYLSGGLSAAGSFLKAGYYGSIK